MSKLFEIKWHDNEILKLTRKQLQRIVSETGLVAEGYAKKELRKGHGVRTGTLRRSIHVAEPGYNWSSDDVEPSESSPELGGKQIESKPEGDHQFVVDIGSGLVYAMPIHQGWSSFEGYHYLTIGVEMALKELGKIIDRYRVVK